MTMSSFSRISAIVETVDPEPYFSIVEERFDIPASTFDDYVLVKPFSKKIYLLPREHRPACRPEPTFMGLPFMRIYLQQPKLSTAAAMHFGHRATKNTIETSADQAEAYLTRNDIAVFNEQLVRCTGRGYVLLQHADLTLGIGFLTALDEGATVRTMFPKAWARAAESFTL